MKNFIPILKFILALLLSLAIVGGIIKVAKLLLPDISTTMAALVAFGGTILAAIINNYFTRIHQIESEERLKKAEIEAENRKEKQKNYNEILTSIGNYIRQPNSANDDFLTIHMKSWIYCNKKIIIKTAELIQLNRENDLTKLNTKLEELLKLMRLDTGLVDIGEQIQIIPPFVERKERGTPAI